ncbi:chemotaxis protein CheW [Paenibacillus naphthalenovorans]|uniref:Chemotaxis protein CheW n=1 Tax=Paenibacillus naphthalenovorans TaxID=162209 RepID=A0A0U2W7H3_9BACL|nr:chemotaxis protein CheW [Paenibacillus naphthalenovorans]ALS22398.1 chemotaxis protein CheW [Paenibacillus naphthalenovorans]
MASSGKITSFNERQLVTFHLGDDEFGADIMHVKEIVRVPEITRVPYALDYIEGACNLRGNVLPVIDGRARFNMERKEKDENSRVLVIDVNGKATGVIVDRVSEVIRVSTSDIEEPPQIVKNVDADYLHGIVKLENGNRLIMLLDIVPVVNGDAEAKTQTNEKDNKGEPVVKSRDDSTSDAASDEQLVSFLLGNEEYSIGIMQVKEIIRLPEMMKVPSCEAYVDGVVSIRNHLLPIINLRSYFGLDSKETTDHTRVLVVDMGGFTAGMIVDKVSEVLRVPAGMIQPPPKFSAQSGEQLKGVAKLDNGKRLIMMLEPSKIISADTYRKISELNGVSMESDGVKSIERQIMDEEQLVAFKMDNEEYGIKIKEVQEINRMTEVTQIPRAPHYINGIVNLRGNIIPVLDLRKFFGLSKKGMTDATRIIIVDSAGVKTGIIVDSVSEVLRFEKALIESPPELFSNGIDSSYVEGVGKLDDGKRMVLILRLDKVLDFEKMSA